MTHVLVFAKAPRDGFVKTRIASEVGAAEATKLYRQVGKQVVQQLSPLPLTIWFDPPEALGELQSWLGDHSFRSQPSGDLGNRLSVAFAEHFRQHSTPAVAVGMDAPDVDVDLVNRAVSELQDADVVVGPAKDGGYYLVGLARMTHVIFHGISWSTGDVCTETVAKCREAGLELRFLETLADMDTLEDAVELGFWPP